MCLYCLLDFMCIFSSHSGVGLSRSDVDLSRSGVGFSRRFLRALGFWGYLFLHPVFVWILVFRLWMNFNSGKKYNKIYINSMVITFNFLTHLNLFELILFGLDFVMDSPFIQHRKYMIFLMCLLICMIWGKVSFKKNGTQLLYY